MSCISSARNIHFLIEKKLLDTPEKIGLDTDNLCNNFLQDPPAISSTNIHFVVCSKYLFVRNRQGNV